MIAPRTGEPDPYMNAGSHPDVVAHVWDVIGGVLPADAAVRICGSPALVHPPTGAVLALAYGTTYALRLLPKHLTLAKQAGASSVTKWSGGQITDLALDFGPDWVFGRCD